MLTEEQVSKYQELYKKRYGIEIGRDEALEEGAKLVRVMQLVYRHITNDDLRKIEP